MHLIYFNSQIADRRRDVDGRVHGNQTMFTRSLHAYESALLQVGDLLRPRMLVNPLESRHLPELGHHSHLENHFTNVLVRVGHEVESDGVEVLVARVHVHHHSPNLSGSPTSALTSASGADR